MRITNRSLFQPKEPAYRIENKADETTIYIYDEISYWGVDAQSFVKDFNKIDSSTIHLRVNSPGGSVFDGTTIFNAIKQHDAKVIAHVDGLAASIASVIIMAADEVIMSDNAFIMIHEPWSWMGGNAADFRKEAELLEKITGTIAKAYTDKTGQKEKDILDMMAEETWFDAEEALEAGFIDSISENDKKETALFDLSIFDKVPKALQEEEKITAREIERILRDAGCSAKQAKSILAVGIITEQRDVVEDVTPPVTVESQRDVEKPVDKPKLDRTTDLLIRAETVN